MARLDIRVTGVGSLNAGVGSTGTASAGLGQSADRINRQAKQAEDRLQRLRENNAAKLSRQREAERARNLRSETANQTRIVQSGIAAQSRLSQQRQADQARLNRQRAQSRAQDQRQARQLAQRELQEQRRVALAVTRIRQRENERNDRLRENSRRRRERLEIASARRVAQRRRRLEGGLTRAGRGVGGALASGGAGIGGALGGLLGGGGGIGGLVRSAGNFASAGVSAAGNLAGSIAGALPRFIPVIGGALGGLIEGGVKALGGLAGGALQLAGEIGGRIAGAIATGAKVALVAGLGLAIASGARAVRGEQIRVAFDSFTQAAGEDAPEALGRLREATRGTVDDIALMQSFLTANQLGAARNTEEFAKLAGAATLLGAAMGRGPVEAINDLSVGFGRQSRLILDNLGIIVSARVANEKYAATLGKTAAELDDTEKKFAFQAEATRQLTANQDKLQGITGTTAQKFAKLKASFLNLVESAGKPLLGILSDIAPELTRIAKRIGEFLEQNKVDIAKKLSAAIKTIPDAIKGAAEFLERFSIGDIFEIGEIKVKQFTNAAKVAFAELKFAAKDAALDVVGSLNEAFVSDNDPFGLSSLFSDKGANNEAGIRSLRGANFVERGKVRVTADVENEKLAARLASLLQGGALPVKVVNQGPEQPQASAGQGASSGPVASNGSVGGGGFLDPRRLVLQAFLDNFPSREEFAERVRTRPFRKARQGIRNIASEASFSNEDVANILEPAIGRAGESSLKLGDLEKSVQALKESFDRQKRIADATASQRGLLGKLQENLSLTVQKEAENRRKVFETGEKILKIEKEREKVAQEIVKVERERAQRIREVTQELDDRLREVISDLKTRFADQLGSARSDFALPSNIRKGFAKSDRIEDSQVRDRLRREFGRFSSGEIARSPQLQARIEATTIDARFNAQQPIRQARLDTVGSIGEQIGPLREELEAARADNSRLLDEAIAEINEAAGKQIGELETQTETLDALLSDTKAQNETAIRLMETFTDSLQQLREQVKINADKLRRQEALARAVSR